jgi:pimeloyl-ACP methyl ester carboxylesterase
MEIEEKITEIYNNKLAQWDPANQTSFITTQYGKVHVIAGGKPENPPLLLLHASSMASWSWLYNVDGLNEYYRTYAIDTIGDAGRSSLANIDIYPQTGEELAALYEEIMDSLHIEKASVIGASQGGYITTNLALYAPDRVDKIVLCGPMGYIGTFRSVMRIIFTTMFPLKPIQENAVRWAFGDDPKVLAEVDEWFHTILEGVISRQARPQTFSQEQLKSLSMPVLLLLGSKDGLVGNPKHTQKRVRNLGNFRTQVLDTGHLISAEKPEKFNKLVLEFLEE